ncbi:MAG: topoisomerase [Polynucleobacter sp. 39-45-136]|jgi:twinkle protein|nr:MAG: topoisomerase [Polynucleobacter sp. 39-45-136]
MESDSNFVQHIPCEKCGSSDANSIYTDGHQFCFACNTHVKGDGTVTEVETKKANLGLITGDYQDLIKRKIRESTCRKYGYQVGDYHGQPVQIAPYFDTSGQMVAQKIRFPNKDFKILGDISKAQLFGANLWNQGKKIVITEGEIDALTVSQVQGNKWPVCSIPNGAQGATKAIKRNLEALSKFEEIVLMFDMDEAGQRAARECAELFEAGKAKVASLPYKDANECLQQGKEDAIIQAIWNAKTFRPDGVISGSDLWDQITCEETVEAISYPWAELNSLTHGARKGELVTLTAGSGIGKSAVVREITHHLLQKNETVGLLMLEENPKRTALGLMGIELNTPLHISKEGISDEEMHRAFSNTVGSGRLYLYNHFGSSDIDNLISRVRYLAKGCGCNWIILDHLSIVVSGLGDGDERRLIDNAMTMLRTLVEETGVGMFLVSHLKRPEGKGHEQGAMTSLSQLRGSHSIAQLSDMVIGLERDQQGKHPNITTLRVLKNRFSGETGIAGYLSYDRETGRLFEIDEPVFKDETRTTIEQEF